MTRGDVVLVRPAHASGGRGKKRPAVVVQSDAYIGRVRTVVVAEVMSNLVMRGDPACLFIDVTTADGQATGLSQDSVVSCLLLSRVLEDSVSQVRGTLSPALRQKLDDALRAALGQP